MQSTKCHWIKYLHHTSFNTKKEIASNHPLLHRHLVSYALSNTVFRTYPVSPMCACVLYTDRQEFRVSFLTVTVICCSREGLLRHHTVLDLVPISAFQYGRMIQGTIWVQGQISWKSWNVLPIHLLVPCKIVHSWDLSQGRAVTVHSWRKCLVPSEHCLLQQWLRDLLEQAGTPWASHCA